LDLKGGSDSLGAWRGTFRFASVPAGSWRGGVGEVGRVASTAAAADPSQLGCEVGAIANSLVFAADGETLLVMTAGRNRGIPRGCASLVGAAAVSRADRAIGPRLENRGGDGGVGPLGIRPIGRWLDVGLAKHDVVWAAAGHPAYGVPDIFR